MIKLFILLQIILCSCQFYEETPDRIPAPEGINFGKDEDPNIHLYSPYY